MNTKRIKAHAYGCLMTATAAFLACAQTASAALTNRYVLKNNPAAAAPYDSLDNAAGNIQTAIDYVHTAAGSTVLVAAATYDSGGTNAGRYLTNRVYISKAITVRSLNNDPTNTIIKGAWDPVATNGWLAIRCVSMVAGSSLIGFTLTNGATLSTNEVHRDLIAQDACGGGVCAWGTFSATISNCIITGNSAWGDRFQSAKCGAGVCDGTYFNCTIIGNSTPNRGGGAESAILSNCTLAGNTAMEAGGGGGSFRGTLYGCLVSNNIATNVAGSWSAGGGLAGWSAASPCRAYNCTIVGNRADRGGGAGPFAILSNCTLTLNSAPVSSGQNGYGGGGYQATMTDCTVTSNSAIYGAGGYSGYYTNCVFAYNSVGLQAPIRACNCLIYACGAGAYLTSGNILDGCTIVGNNSGVYDYWSGAAGIVHVRNSVVYSNEVNWTRTDGSFAFTNTCTFPAYSGWSAGNITNDPRLVSYGRFFGTAHVPGNYRLQATSPCVNRGLNQDWMTNALDLDRRARIRYGTVDMGAYEVMYSGAIFKFR